MLVCCWREGKGRRKEDTELPPSWCKLITHLDGRLLLDALLETLCQRLVELAMSAVCSIRRYLANLLQDAHCELRRDVARRNELVERVGQCRANTAIVSFTFPFTTQLTWNHGRTRSMSAPYPPLLLTDFMRERERETPTTRWIATTDDGRR